jgi:hypothetical protein
VVILNVVAEGLESPQGETTDRPKPGTECEENQRQRQRYRRTRGDRGQDTPAVEGSSGPPAGVTTTVSIMFGLPIAPNELSAHSMSHPDQSSGFSRWKREQK